MALGERQKRWIGPYAQLLKNTLEDGLMDSQLSLEEYIAEKDLSNLESDLILTFRKINMESDATKLAEQFDRARRFQQTGRLRPYLLNIAKLVLVDLIDVETLHKGLLALSRDVGNAIIVSQPTTPTALRTKPMEPPAIEQSLLEHWQKTYVGPSCEVLKETIRENEKLFLGEDTSGIVGRRYYSKTVTFIQSSGTGKSRLANEYGKICPQISYVIREPGSGFPPSDNAVYQFMRSSLPSELEQFMRSPPTLKKIQDRSEYIWFHAVAIGIIQATFHHCNEEAKKWTKWIQSDERHSVALAAKFRELLYDMKNLDMRSEFCKKVVDTARNISILCVKDGDFRCIFNNPDESIRKALEVSDCSSIIEFHTATHCFQETLAGWRLQDRNDPVFTVVFDEVGSLMTDDGNARFIALNQIISVVSENYKIWFLFLSTESKADALLPPDGSSKAVGPNKPSARLPLPATDPPLRRYEPFVSFAVDMGIVKNDSQLVTAESMVEFSKIRHLGKFGRPLWSAYDKPDQVACVKLVGGSHGYNPKNRDHVFAALSFRLCLDVNMSSPITYPLSQTAVHLHMRMVESLDPIKGSMSTCTPGEPILAFAAAEYLRPEGSWRSSLETFTSELLSFNAIDKGTKGELVARLLFTLARDHAVKYKPSVEGTGSERSVPSFTVRSLLASLFSEKFHSEIDLIDPNILNGHMNFLMFTSTAHLLSGDSLGELCHKLLRRSTALQCAPQQERYDLIIPFYWGEHDQPFDSSEAGAIVVQVKNRRGSRSPSIWLNETFVNVSDTSGQKPPNKKAKTRSSKKLKPSKNFIFDDPDAKLLYIHLDLGVDGPAVTVQKSKNTAPTVWAIHTKGNNENVFRCLSSWGVAQTTEKFFPSLIEPPLKNHAAFRKRPDPIIDVIEERRRLREPEETMG